MLKRKKKHKNKNKAKHCGQHVKPLKYQKTIQYIIEPCQNFIQNSSYYPNSLIRVPGQWDNFSLISADFTRKRSELLIRYSFIDDLVFYCQK